MGIHRKNHDTVLVLHVDDDAAILEITKAYLEKSGRIEVISCLSVPSAFEMLTEHQVDIIVSDYEMPDMDGIRLLRTIRGHGCTIPFILFTGRGRESIMVEAFNCGATAYIQKTGEPGLQFTELAGKILQAAAQHRSSQKVSQLSRLFGALRTITNTLQADGEMETTLERICTVITSENGYRDMRIVLFDNAGEITRIYQSGLDEQMHSFISYVKAGKRTSCLQKALESPGSPVICAPDRVCLPCPLFSGHLGYHTLTMRLEHNGICLGIISYTLEPGQASDPDEQAVISDISREVAYTVHVCNQIKEQNEMEKLIGKNKKLDILNTITRHDIRNELTSQMFHYENLLELSEKYPEIREDVIELGSSLNNVAEHLMFSDVYQKIGMEKPKWLSIDSIIENIIQTHAFGSISIIHSTGTLEVYTDPMFGKIIINLVENALMHGCRVTTLQIGFLERLDCGILFVEDDGMGVHPDRKQKIFERGVGRNTGLGLFYTREILGITGMSITETGIHGEGARFEIQIPKNCFRMHKGESFMPVGSSRLQEKGIPDE